MDKIGYKNDEIFLLSFEEYKKYEEKIPGFLCWWWLRSPGYSQNYAAYVYYVGSVYFSGINVNLDTGCVRPALNISNLDPANLKFVNTDKIVYCGITWVKIDDNFYIAETPIATHNFDRETNDYGTSEIRRFLLDWYEQRKGW